MDGKLRIYKYSYVRKCARWNMDPYRCSMWMAPARSHNDTFIFVHQTWLVLGDPGSPASAADRWEKQLHQPGPPLDKHPLNIHGRLSLPMSLSQVSWIKQNFWLSGREISPTSFKILNIPTSMVSIVDKHEPWPVIAQFEKKTCCLLYMDMTKSSQYWW